MLTDEQWAIAEPLLTGKKTDIGRTGDNNRMSLEGILYQARTNCPRRDLPMKYGSWKTVHKRLMRFISYGVMDRLFDAIPDLDFTAVYVDGSFAQVHAHGTGFRRNGLTGAASRVKQCIGKTAGGFTSKIMAAVDAEGRPAALTLAPGNRNEGKLIEALLKDIQPEEVVADRAYDSIQVRKMLESKGVEKITIPSKRNRKVPIEHDTKSYAKRHLVETFFGDIKYKFLAVAFRRSKLATTFLATVRLGAWYNDSRRYAEKYQPTRGDPHVE